ncbi:MAG: hypothetical protein ACREX3_21230 [Gammaproteobacteria bacterium]
MVEGLRTLLRGGTAVERLEESFEIVRSLPHGHVNAVLGTLRKIGLERLIAPQRSPERDRVVAMVVARLLDPRSKLATARGVGEGSASTSLGEVLDLNDCMPPWTGCKPVRVRSKKSSLKNSSRTARWCSMT